MKKIYIVLLIFGLLTGCRNDASETMRVANLSFDISRSAENLQNDVSMKTGFIENDRMGLFANDKQCLWKYTKGKWTAIDPFYWFDNETVSFCAYYPFDQQAKLDCVPMPSLDNQTGSESDMLSRDFVTGTRSVSFSENNGNVEFIDAYAMTHQYAMLVLTIKSSLSTAPAILYSVNVQGKALFNSAYYSFSDYKIHVSPTETKDNLTITSSQFPEISGGRDYLLLKLLVNPLTLDTNSQVTLGYEYKGNRYDITVDRLPAEFKAGFYYKYDLLINTKGELTVTGVEVNGRDEIVLPNIVLPERSE